MRIFTSHIYFADLTEIADFVLVFSVYNKQLDINHSLPGWYDIGHLIQKSRI
jgi:hypothetical protein